MAESAVATDSPDRPERAGESGGDMSELRAAVRTLARMMPLILLAAAIVGTAVYVFRQDAPKVYQSTSRYFVSPVTEIQGGDVGDLVDALNTLDREVMTISVAEVLGSDVMLQRAAASLGIADISEYSASAARVPSSLAVEVYVQGPSAEGTRQVSEGIGTEANTLLRDLIGAFEIQPLDVPTTPTSPISPRPLRDALFAGVLVVVGLSMIRLVTSPPDETGVRRSMWVRLRDAALRGRSKRKPVQSRLELRPEAVKPLGDAGGAGQAKRVEHPLNGADDESQSTEEPPSPAEAALSAFDELAAADFRSESSRNR